ncbi:MAG: hypothetical protein LBQ27_04295 [Clostridiales bacterium]|jgi:cell division protein FtsA|nr:hypothetical protein [Clostridiales bacterium]
MIRNNEVAVLDIGSGTIRVAVAEKNNRSNIVIRGIGEIKYSGYFDGEWIEPEEMRQVILSAVSKAEFSSGVKIKKLYVGVPSEFTYSVCKEAALFFDREREIGSGEVETLFRRNDKFEDNDEYETIDISAVYFLLSDNKRIIEPRGIMSDKIKALTSYVRCKKTFITEIRDLLSSVNIHAEFVSSVLAEITYLFEPQQRDRYILFVDSGYLSTSVALLRGDGLLNLSSFSLGGGHITADISEMFDLPFDESEYLKERSDVAYADANARIRLNSIPNEEVLLKDVSDIVSARLEDFAEEISCAIKSGKYDCPQHVTLFLTGGGLSYIKGAKDFLSELIGRNVEIIAPNVPKYDKPHFSSLFGLINIAGVNIEAETEPKKGLINIFNKIIGGKGK